MEKARKSSEQMIDQLGHVAELLRLVSGVDAHRRPRHLVVRGVFESVCKVAEEKQGKVVDAVEVEVFEQMQGLIDEYRAANAQASAETQ